MDGEYPGLRLPTGPQFPRWPRTLADGTHVVVRPLVRQDGAVERLFGEGMGRLGLHFHFLGSQPGALDGPPSTLRVGEHAYDTTYAAVIPDSFGERCIGVSRMRTCAHGVRCEGTVSVGNLWWSRGLALSLAQHLIEIARGRGIQLLVAMTAAEDTRARQLAEELGFRSRQAANDPGHYIHLLRL